MLRDVVTDSVRQALARLSNPQILVYLRLAKTAKKPCENADEMRIGEPGFLMQFDSLFRNGFPRVERPTR